MDEFSEANRALWNAWTRINLASEFYDVEGFASGRARDLDPIARAGPGDVRGKSLLHLQCHFGMDTIRWAQQGAMVTAISTSCPRSSRAASTSSSPPTECSAGSRTSSGGPS